MMDYTWIILFILISIVSAVLSKRKEKRDEAKRQPGRAETEERGERRPTVGTGPPVAPGPFGPVLRPKPSRLPEPKPATVQQRKPEPAAEASAPPAERPKAGGALFEEMRTELEQRTREETAPEEEPAPEPQPEAWTEPEWKRPEPVAPPHRLPPPGPMAPAQPVRPAPVREELTTTHRAVRQVGVREPARGVRKVGWVNCGRRSLRRAFVMAEILNKPVGMRFERQPWDLF